MSEREEYTPSLDHVRNKYARIMKTDGAMAQAISKQKEFDRAVADHDRALRERIAREIEVEMRRHDNAQIGFSAVGDAYAHAARIARGKDQTDE